MKKVPLVVTFVTLYALFFQVEVYSGSNLDLILVLLAFSPFLLLFMVYVILKYGKSSGHTFDERFYDDWDYGRNGSEEIQKD